MDKILTQIISNIKYLVIIVFALILVLGSWFMVGPGVVGVTFNTITGKTQSYPQGMYMKLPMVTNVTKFDVKTQRQDIEADSASMDLQKVKVHVVVNYHLDYTKVNDLYVKVGIDFAEKVIVPAVNESVKASTAQFDVEKIIEQREKVKVSVEDSLRKRLAEYNIILESVNLVDIEFDPEFNKVVEEKQVEQQKIKTAQYLREQAEENKKRTILEAQAEAEKQRLLSVSVTKDVISLKWIEKWNGQLPTYMMGDKTTMMITPK